jgi:hypothetical protein
MSLKNPVTRPGIDPGTVAQRSALTTTLPQAPNLQTRKNKTVRSQIAPQKKPKPPQQKKKGKK